MIVSAQHFLLHTHPCQAMLLIRLRLRPVHMSLGDPRTMPQQMEQHSLTSRALAGPNELLFHFNMLGVCD